MQRSLLEEYLDACDLIEETERDLARVKAEFEHAAVDSVKGSNQNFPYEPRVFRIEGVSYGEYKNPDEVRQVESLLKERRKIAKQKRLAVDAWMNTIPSRIARIVRMKYFKGMTWAQVSRSLGYLSPDAARMELYRFMKCVDDGSDISSK